ncbi:hypothetical protein ACFPZP_20645 [Citrobacter bitternis]|uniref:Uncharacterized protein n=1 Tax=Citrobacter bitternis TaxID=1585982 RepID=A0ABW1Q3J6_9ENTR|nr:hypothetical protein [Klebsiella pneumoniae]
MKNLLKTVRDSIAAAMNGRTIEQMETEQLKQNVKNAVDDYLIRHPDWQPSTQPGKAGLTSKTLTAVHAAASANPSPAVVPVRDSKQKAKRVMKSLGAGAGVFTPHIVDEEALRRAREAARAFQAAEPERYGDIITATPIKGV